MKRLVVLMLLLVVVANAYAASDFMYGGVNCGQTSRMLNLVFRLTTDNTEATGVLASQVTANYWRQGGSRTSIATATLANAAVAYASGGFVEVDGTNMKGLYRLDIPDAAIACGSDWVTLNVVRVYGSATYVYYERFGLASAPDVNVIRWNQNNIAATQVDANVTRWNGANVAATNVDANVQQWRTATPNALTNSRVPVAAQIQQNVALGAYTFLITDNTNHAPKAGAAALACTRSIDGAAFGACANTPTEVANGIYTLSMANTDLNGKVVVFRITSTNNDDTFFTLSTAP